MTQLYFAALFTLTGLVVYYCIVKSRFVQRVDKLALKQALNICIAQSWLRLWTSSFAEAQSLPSLVFRPFAEINVYWEIFGLTCVALVVYFAAKRTNARNAGL